MPDDASLVARCRQGDGTAWAALVSSMSDHRTLTLSFRPERLPAEAADVIYHLLVMLAARDVALADVLEELDRRTDRSGIAEKAGR